MGSSLNFIQTDCKTEETYLLNGDDHAAQRLLACRIYASELRSEVVERRATSELPISTLARNIKENCIPEKSTSLGCDEVHAILVRPVINL